MDITPLFKVSRPLMSIEAMSEIVDSMIQVPESYTARFDVPSVGFGFEEFDAVTGDELAKFSSPGNPFSVSPNVSPNVGFEFGEGTQIENLLQDREGLLEIEAGTVGISPRRTTFCNSPNVGCELEGEMKDMDHYTLGSKETSVGSHPKLTMSPESMDSTQTSTDTNEPQTPQGSSGGVRKSVMEGFSRTCPKPIAQVSGEFDNPVNPRGRRGGGRVGSAFFKKKLETRNYTPHRLAGEDDDERQRQGEYKNEVNDGGDEGGGGGREKQRGNTLVSREKKGVFKLGESGLAAKQAPSSTRGYKLRSRHKANRSQPDTGASADRPEIQATPPLAPRMDRLRITLGEEITDFEDYLSGCSVYDDFGRKVIGYQLDPF